MFKKKKATIENISAALNKVIDPKTQKGLEDAGIIGGININGDTVFFSMELEDEKDSEHMEIIKKSAEQAVMALSGVTSAVGVFTGKQQGGVNNNKGEKTPPPPPEKGIGGVQHIIAVASGKGGVGKSTIALNLALSLSKGGAAVGLLDADIYGPSQPRLLDIKEKPESDGKIIRPHEKFGIKVMSIGFMVGEDTPMIWRGPMVQSALMQLLGEVKWGNLDYLILDMPPGTGDTQLTMSQQVPLSGAVIVSTPQDIALIDARKGWNMFKKVNVPLLGIIENMSYFQCPHCHEKTNIFSHGGARDVATSDNIPFLGEVPLDIKIRENSDNGTPIVMSEPDGEHSKKFAMIARNLIDSVNVLGKPAAPTITMN